MDYLVILLFLTLEIACGVAILVRFRSSIGGILGGVAFGVMAFVDSVTQLLVYFESYLLDYFRWIQLLDLAAFGLLLAAILNMTLHARFEETLTNEEKSA